MDELKECPWCTDPPISGRISAGLTGTQWVAYCDNIDCPVQPMTDGFETEAEAIAAWNHRSAPNRERKGDEA